MPRDLTSDYKVALQHSEPLTPILLAKIEAKNNNSVRVWTGNGDITFENEVYNGTGQLGSISAVTEISDLSAQGVSFTLQGVDSGIISTALGEIVQGKQATLWIGLFDQGLSVSSPYKIFEGITDIASVSDGIDTATITIVAENKLVRLEQPNIRRYTDSDQREEFAGDKGFEFVPGLQDKVLKFGSG